MDTDRSLSPLPRPIGRNIGTVINQPVKLFISERTFGNPTRIADAFGREVIDVQYGSYGLTVKKYNIICCQSGNHLYTLRKAGRTAAPGFVTVETPKKEPIATFDHEGNVLDGQWGVLWSNTAGQGENVALNTRGGIRDRFPSLVWGPSPVILFDRTGADGPKVFSTIPRDYQALVAPGADLIWMATLIVAFELINFPGWS